MPCTKYRHIRKQTGVKHRRTLRINVALHSRYTLDRFCTLVSYYDTAVYRFRDYSDYASRNFRVPLNSW